MFLLLNILKEASLHVISWAATLIIIIPVGITFLTFGALKGTVNWFVLKYNSTWVPLSALDLACSVFFNPLDGPEANNNIGFTLIIDSEVGIDQIRQDFALHLLNLRATKHEFSSLGTERSRIRNLHIVSQCQGPANGPSVPQSKEFSQESDDVNRERLPKYFAFDRLRMRPIKYFGNYYWRSIPGEEIDLNKLIWERNQVKKTDLTRFLGQWLKINYKENGPMWEAVIYRDSDTYYGKTVFAFKMSHVLGDGITITKMAEALCNSRVTDNLNVHRTGMGLTAVLCAPRMLLGQSSAIALHSDLISRTKKSNEMCLTFGSIDLNPVRGIAKANKCKVNDVLINLWSNCLRRILMEVGVEEAKLPKSIRVVSPRAIPGRDKEMDNRMTLGILEVEIQNPNRREKLTNFVNQSRKLFKCGLYDVMEKVLELAYYLPLCFVIPTDKAHPGVTCAVTSYPIPTLMERGGLAFGKYRITSFYALQQLFTKDFGFSSTFVTTGSSKIDVTVVGNQAIVKTQEIMDMFPKYLKDELKEMQANCLIQTV